MTLVYNRAAGRAVRITAVILSAYSKKQEATASCFDFTEYPILRDRPV